MPITIKNRRSGTGGQAWPTDLEPGQVALNTADRQVVFGDANGPDGAAPAIEHLAITLFDPNASYVADNMVVYQNDVYVANTTHTGSWDPTHFDYVRNPPLVATWPTELEDNRVGYGWSLSTADGLVLNRDPDAAIRFISDTDVGKSGFHFGNPVDLEAGAIEWNASVGELKIRHGVVDVMRVGDTYVGFDVQVQAPDGVIQDNRGGYGLQVGGAETIFFRHVNGSIYHRAFGNEVLKFDHTGFYCGDGDYEPALRLSDGSLSAPSLAFAGDTKSGAYRIGSNHWTFVANDKEMFGCLSSHARSADITMSGTQYVYFRDDDSIDSIALEPTYADIGFDETIFFGDLAGKATRYRGQQDHGISYVRTDNTHLLSMSVYDSAFINRGTVQVRDSVWVGVSNPQLLGDGPKFVHTRSSVGRSYAFADSTEFVLERSGDCYLSVIGTSVSGINLGDSSSETTFGIISGAGGMAMQAGSNEMLVASNEQVQVDKLTAPSKLYASKYLVPVSVQTLAKLVYNMKAVDARITAAGG